MSQRGLASYGCGINILQQLSFSSPRTNDRIAMVDPCIETDCSGSFGRNIAESKAACDNDLTTRKKGAKAKVCVNHEIGDGPLFWPPEIGRGGKQTERNQRTTH